MMGRARDEAAGGTSPLVVVVTGPSGVGKDAVLQHLKALGRPWHFAITATTRKPRPDERHGVDYLFLERHAFQEMLQREELLEHAQVYGEWYGVPRSQVRDALDRGLDAIIKVDVQGAATIKKLVPEAVFIFVAPPSIEELERRLRGRATESSASLERRLTMARDEMERVALCDYVVVNHSGRHEEAAACVEAIITAEKCRVRPRRVSI